MQKQLNVVSYILLLKPHQDECYECGETEELTIIVFTCNCRIYLYEYCVENYHFYCPVHRQCPRKQLYSNSYSLSSIEKTTTRYVKLSYCSIAQTKLVIISHQLHTYEVVNVSLYMYSKQTNCITDKLPTFYICVAFPLLLSFLHILCTYFAAYYQLVEIVAH